MSVNLVTKCPRLGCSFGGTSEEIDEHNEKMDKHGLHEAQVSSNPKPFCIGCIRVPDEITAYHPDLTQTGLTPDEYVKREEGTYNKLNGHFLCDMCYLGAGAPSGPNGWVAP